MSQSDGGKEMRGMRTGGGGPLTVSDIRDAILGLPDDVEIDFGSTLDGTPLRFYRFKRRGDKILQIELNEDREDFSDRGQSGG